MFSTLKTNPDLIRKMRESASRPMTKEQVERQRVSFVYGNLPSDSAITREQVVEKLRSNDGVGEAA